MAYKEFNVSSDWENNNARLDNRSDPAISGGDYPSEAEYLLVRDADEAYPGDVLYGNMRVGQRCTYITGDDVYYYHTHRCSLYFPNTYLGQKIKVGAPIESAYLKFFMIVESNVNPSQEFDIVVQNGQPTYPHSPPVCADYDLDNMSGDGGSLDGILASDYGWKEIALNEDGKSWLGVTEDLIGKLFFVSSRDIAGLKPVGNFVCERTTVSRNSPYHARLFIRVTLSIPTAVTDDYTNKGASAATFNGEVTHSGFWLDSYGFEWKQGESGDISSITVGTSKTRGLTFSYHKTGLSGTIYYRAWGNNGAGKGYGEWKLITWAAVTTQAVSSVGIEHAKGNGTVTGANITERGFEVRLPFAGTLGDYIKRATAGFVGIDVVCSSFGYWEGYVVKTKRYVGTFEAGAFVGDLGRFPTAVFSDQLFAGETYNYRAYAVIDGETYHGSYVAFTTNTWPAGEGPEDRVSPGVPIVSISEEEELLPFWEWPEIVFPPWVIPSFVLPPFEYDPSIIFGHTFGAFLRRLDTKEDWQTLREKCIIYQENMNQFTLTVNHNTLVLKNLVNDIITYIDGNVYPSNLKLMDSSQHLTPLYLEEISPDGFKDIINDFRLKDVCNVYELNQNFQRMLQSLNSLYSSDYTIEPISYNTREYIDIQPTAKRMILQLEDMRKKSREVQRLIIENIKRIFTYV
jgi:hypothetical protein